MEWFSGTVEDALQEYQAKNGLCIVYITRGEAESNQASVAFEKIWDIFDQFILYNIPYVAIKLIDGSDGAKQFAEFFPLPIVPVCYVLGLNGQPLEVISAAEKLNTERFNELLRNAISLYRSQLKDSGIPLPEDKQQSQSSDESGIPKNSQENKGLNQPSDETGIDLSGIPIDERVEYAKKRLEEKRKADEAQKREEEQRKELNRRNEGKILADLKEKNRERELREAAELRRKDKENDAAALKRLREQIKQDREERLSKSSKSGEENKAQATIAKTDNPNSSSSVASKPTMTEECRIQCKFPNGSVLTKVFQSNSELQVVVDAIKEDGRLQGAFFLVQAYPRRQLNDFNKSLMELELTPSSALLVISENQSQKSKSLMPATGGYLNLLLGFFYTPLLVLYNFVTSLFNFRGDSAPRSNAGPTPTNPTENTATDRRSGGVTRREGNVTRLRNGDDSDNENATWNGNSTQQL